MGPARKRHVQGELFPKHGGKRNGAGRPPKNKLRPSQPHKKRPAVKKSVPLHVTARVVDELAELRQRDAYKAIRRAMTHVYARDEFHIVHVSIERSHIHFIIEASDRMALARGMKALEISAAKLINRAFSKHRSRRRRGQVFCDRYDAEPITNRRQARNTLAYVLKNASHCTLSGRRVEFPTCWAQTRLLQRAQSAVGYRRPRFEDFIWDRPPLPWPGQIDFEVRNSARVPQQLQS